MVKAESHSYHLKKGYLTCQGNVKRAGSVVGIENLADQQRNLEGP